MIVTCVPEILQLPGVEPDLKPHWCPQLLSLPVQIMSSLSTKQGLFCYATLQALTMDLFHREKNGREPTVEFLLHSSLVLLFGREKIHSSSWKFLQGHNDPSFLVLIID